MSNVAILHRQYHAVEASFAEATTPGMVVVVVNDPMLARSVDAVCDFLGFGVEHVGADQDITQVLDELRPMAVIAEAEGQDQDGYHVMMMVADHNRALPLMLLTGGDPALVGAADAVQELWGLESVSLHMEHPGIGDLVDFLFRASRRAGSGRLLPV